MLVLLRFALSKDRFALAGRAISARQGDSRPDTALSRAFAAPPALRPSTAAHALPLCSFSYKDPSDRFVFYSARQLPLFLRKSISWASIIARYKRCKSRGVAMSRLS